MYQNRGIAIVDFAIKMPACPFILMRAVSVHRYRGESDMAEFISSELGGWLIVLGMIILMILFRRRRNQRGSDTGLWDETCDGDGGD